MVQNISNEAKNSLVGDLKFLMVAAFAIYIASMFAILLTGFKMRRISRQGYIERAITRHFNESVERISKEGGTEPPYIHLVVSDEDVKSELEKCTIVPQPKTLLYVCEELQTIYIQGQVINSIERELGRSLVFPRSYESLPDRYLKFITELGITKYITSTKQPSISKIDRAISAYCLVGQSSYTTNSGSHLKQDEILENHVRVSNFITEDISLRQQILAFKKGWSGKSCS